LKRLALCLLPLLLASVCSHAADRADLIVADFEGETYGDWLVEGEAFGPGPAVGALPGQMAVSGFQGKRLVNSFFRGDDTTGRLLSPPFRVERRYLNFLLGGGKNPEKLSVNLLVDGKVTRSASGPNDAPGGSEQLEWHTWDLKALEGKTVRVEIVDQATGGWGHINVDQFTQSDVKAAVEELEQSRPLKLTRRYLLLPVKNGAPKRRVALLLDGQPKREFEIELAPGEPDFWSFLDLQPFQGKSAMLRVDRLPEGSRALEAVTQGDEIPAAVPMYREKLRPQVHFSTRRGWINDPNGLVYHNGEYHLYYQHNPYGWGWGNMHWGHAVSKDLVRWRELPIALYPQRFGDWAFSGSAAVDRQNTGGFKTGKQDVIVAAYTSTGRGECIVYSNDNGRTFEEYAGNPVLKHDGRDPKILWYEPGKHWVMVVYDVRDKKNGLLFLTSPDLKKWEQHGWIDGYFECPELFELAVDGDKKNTRWVLYGADGSYALGRFDGKTFTPEGGKQPANWGNVFYASQTYNDLPAADGRRIRVGWATVATPGMPFNQMMNFPVELKLQTTAAGPRLAALPVREVEKLYARRHTISAEAVRAGSNPLEKLSGDLWDLRADLEPDGAAEIGFRIRGVPVVYDVKAGTLTCQGKTAPLPLVEGRVRLRLLVDRTSIEIFGADGLIYMPIGVIPKDDNHSLDLFTAGGGARIRSLEAIALKSAWE
jgi:fructan beta-fructosidase